MENLNPQEAATPTEGTSRQETPYDALSEKECRALKLWLFSENIRLNNERKALAEAQNKFLKEKKLFQDEMNAMTHQMTVARQRLKQDEQFFDKKMEILKSGFAQLEQDRQVFEREKSNYRKKEDVYSGFSGATADLDVSLLFAGVKNPLALRKRYKDLLKIFHPDNLAGDKEAVQLINKEYERLKSRF